MLKLIDQKGDDKIIEADGKSLKITNTGKVFWPEEGYTKGDLIEYYTQIADYILPYLKDRPESLRRYPNGIEGKTFFQKNIDGLAPPWMRTIDIFSEDKGETTKYMVADDLAGLLFMVNLGCIDINPWNSRVEALNDPDYLILDLDPEDIDFNYVRQTALAVKKVCDRLDIPAFPKTSGATGIHIFIPLGAQYSYEQCRNFAQILADFVHQTAPDFTSLERSPRKRQKKVYIDYLQNSEGQTLAAPYSVRPKPGATVSTPLEWPELESEIKPEDFTIENIFNRLKKKGDIFRGALGKGIDINKLLQKIEMLA